VSQAAAKIAVRGISKRFGHEAEGTLALEDVSLEVYDGEFLSILGESGCGKTTLLRILAGLLPPTHGAVTIDGQPVSRPRRDVGFVFQRPVLLEWRTVLDNVLLPMEIRGWERDAHAPAARDLLKLVGLEGFEGHYPRQLSGGMQHRVALARALLLQPAILLMDEPFGALDAMTREQLHLELLHLWKGRRLTAIFITHDIGEAVFLSDRVVLLSRRPGTVRRIFRVSLPRPRALEVKFTEPFGALGRAIKAAME
jgi:NitT/TauT family transport system ATP-binding protein